MKKQLLALSCALISLSAMGQYGQLPNVGFENWTTNILYEDLDDWFTSNYIDGSIVNVTKSSDANSGNFSAKVSNIVLDGDTILGFSFLGTIGEEGPNGGTPYASPCDQLLGSFKHNIATGDTAMLLVIKYLAGTQASLDVLPIIGNQATWTNFTMPINATNQDAIFLGVISANPFGNDDVIDPSNFVMIDDVSLSHSVLGAGVALPNPGFENWSDISAMQVDGWDSFNELLASSGLVSAERTNDAVSQPFAAKLTTLDMQGDTLPGALIFETLTDDFDVLPGRFNGLPTHFNFQYKYTPSGLDTAFAMVQLFVAGNPIGVEFLPLTTTAAYTPVSLALSFIGQPDSALVIFVAGDNPGSELFVDDVQFAGGNASISEAYESDIVVFPNPVDDILKLEFEEFSGRLEIREITGKLIHNSQLLKVNNFELNTSSIPNGAYLVVLRNATGSRAESIIISH